MYVDSGNLVFLHFGTSSEVLDHLEDDRGGRLARNYFTAIPSCGTCDVAPSAIILASDLRQGVSIGAGSLVFDCTLDSSIQIGARCVVTGVHSSNQSKTSKHVLLDSHCLWEVPVSGELVDSRVTLCCGINDDPKLPKHSGGTFCGKLWDTFLAERGISGADLWGQDSSNNLWNAKLFPVVSKHDGKNDPGGIQGIDIAMWLMGVWHKGADHNQTMLKYWQSLTERVSLQDIHNRIDFKQMYYDVNTHRAALAAGFARASIESGQMDRNLAKLCQVIVHGNTEHGSKICMELAASCSDPLAGHLVNVPASRVYQAQVDIYDACGNEIAKSVSEAKVWDAVASETMAVVGKAHEGKTCSTFTSNLQPGVCMSCTSNL